MSLLDSLTGGKSSEADEALQRAESDIHGIQAPTVEGLTLPELQKYVIAGVMTPAQAKAILQKSNAYDSIKTDPASREAEMTALSQMQEVASDDGMTPQMRAKIAAANDQAASQTQGSRAAILDSMAQRGIPTSLMGTAMQEAAGAQDSRTANLTATAAAGDAEKNALTAMANSGTLSGNIHAQDYGEASQKAAAQNAIDQWNAQNQTNVNETNANRKQQAVAYDTGVAQETSDRNTGGANARTQYNANLPETVFQNQLQKAGAEAGVSEKQADQSTAQGQQEAGLIGGILGGASQMGAAYYTGGASEAMAEGGKVPGTPDVPGDSPRNDKVHAMLSPGEVVVPRTIAHDPNRVKQFVSHLLKQPKPIRPMHPEDLHAMMEALNRRREAA